MYILGISAYYHDSAAVLTKNGRVLTAIEEERFSRIKHDNSFPFRAITYCLASNNLSIDDIDYVSYYEKPLRKFERIIENFVLTFPRSFRPFLESIPGLLSKKIDIESTIKKGVGYYGKILYIPHHFSHASSAFFPSPFKKAAVLTIDGVGEYQTTGLWLGENNKIKPLLKMDFPHSLGLLYSTFTAFLGFRVNEDEYKLMGLSAYGKPIYKKAMEKIIDIKPDGSFNLDMDYFSFRQTSQMWSSKLEKLLGGPRLSPEPISIRHKNIAASVQALTEEVYLKILNHLYDLTKTPSLCISGGVALNALANGKIFTHTPFSKVYVFGAAGDSGAALGSCLYIYHSLLEKRRREKIRSLSLGSLYENSKIEAVLKGHSLNYKKLGEKELVDETAKLLAEGKIVGWFNGRCEFGPRALGNRSILAKPSLKEMKTKINIIKRREQFRPFAGSVLQEQVHKYFEVPEKKHWSPFMVFCFKVRKEKQNELTSIVHKDQTSRIQTVNEDNGIYYHLIKRFNELTGNSCLLNTSFNLKGEPIVETPEQAVVDFLKTKMDNLVIGSYLVYKVNRRG